MAVVNYEYANGHFPPRTTADGYHSWRTLVLPFLEEHRLYDSIDFDSRWNSDHNKQFHHPALHGLQCHNREDQSGNTQIFAVHSPDSIWQDREIGYDEIEPAQILLFVELDLPRVNWMSTTDIAMEELIELLKQHGKLPSPHPNVVLMGFADGHVSAVPHEQITPEFLRDRVSIDEILPHEQHEPQANAQ